MWVHGINIETSVAGQGAPYTLFESELPAYVAGVVFTAVGL